MTAFNPLIVMDQRVCVSHYYRLQLLEIYKCRWKGENANLCLHFRITIPRVKVDGQELKDSWPPRRKKTMATIQHDWKVTPK